MARLERWQARPPEEANLFNPPFVCALIVEFLKDFSKGNKDGASLFLIVIAATTGLHRGSRQRLPYSTVTPLFSWVQENEDLLVGFGARARNVTSYIKEAIIFGLSENTIQVSNDGRFILGSSKIGVPKSFLDQTTQETKEIFDRMKFIGRWFSKSGSEVSIAATLGVKP